MHRDRFHVFRVRGLPLFHRQSMPGNYSDAYNACLSHWNQVRPASAVADEKYFYHCFDLLLFARKCPVLQGFLGLL